MQFKYYRSITILLVACIAILLGYSTCYAGIQAEFDLYVESDTAVLYMNSLTTEIALKHKHSDTVWYSNPVNRDQDSIARGNIKDELNSQLIFDYHNPEGIRQTMNNYGDSIRHSQFDISEIENGFRVDYLIGRQWSEDDLVPVMISKQRMEEQILQNLSAEDQEFVLNQYQLIHLTEAPPDYERVSVLNMDKDALFGSDVMLSLTDQLLEGTTRRNLIQSVAAHIVDNRSDYEGRQDLKPENFAHFMHNPTYVLSDRIRAWDWTSLIEIIEASGYSPWDTQIDHEANKIDPPQENICTFTITVEYRLDGDDLIVNIPVDQLKYPQNVIDAGRDYRSVSFPLTNLSILPYFGAADNQATGYMFIPDGSGALIYLNSEKRFTSPYEKYIYGRDYAVNPIINMPFSGQQIHLPVFGLKQGDQAFLAIIEEGDALGRIRADTAGRNDSYNNVYSNFNLRRYAQLSMEYDGSTTYLNVYQHRIYQGNIRIRYKFLVDDHADYVGMAHCYQDYLVKKHAPEPLSKQEKPFIIDLLAAIDHVEPFLGFPRQVVYPLTDFAQVKELVASMHSNGIDKLQIRYSGWLKGGLRHDYPQNARLEPALGTETEWYDLLEYLNENEVEFYPDVDLLLVYNNSIFNRFNVRSDASRFISRQAARLYNYNVATSHRQPGPDPYIVSPRKLGSIINSFAATYKRYDISALALRDYGIMLNSDYRLNEKELVDRQQARVLLTNEISKLNYEYQLDLLVDGANSYVLPYVKTVVNIPLETSALHIIDQGIPFLPMVLNGYWVFAGEPLNLVDNYRQALLKSFETGASPYFLWTWAESSQLKRTDFDQYYTVCYQDWLDEVVKFYNEGNSLLDAIHGEKLIGHKQLAASVFLSTFENGINIITNYNKYPVNVGRYYLESESYLWIEGDPDEI